MLWAFPGIGDASTKPNLKMRRDVKKTPTLERKKLQKLVMKIHLINM
jgi:hypothetical protein